MRRIYQKALPWPQSTMLRFDAFLGQADALQGYDYLFFATPTCTAPASSAPTSCCPTPAAGQSLTAVCHLPYYGKKSDFPPPMTAAAKSRASIPVQLRAVLRGGRAERRHGRRPIWPCAGS